MSRCWSVLSGIHPRVAWLHHHSWAISTCVSHSCFLCLQIWFLSALNLTFLLPICWSIDNITKTKLEEERVTYRLYSPSLRKVMVGLQGRNQVGWHTGYCPSVRKVMVGRPGRNQETGTEADAIEESCLLTWSPWLAHLAFFYNPGPRTFPHPSFIKRLPYRHPPTPIWWRQFLDWDSLSRWLYVVWFGHNT